MLPSPCRCPGGASIRVRRRRCRRRLWGFHVARKSALEGGKASGPNDNIYRTAQRRYPTTTECRVVVGGRERERVSVRRFFAPFRLSVPLTCVNVAKQEIQTQLKWAPPLEKRRGVCCVEEKRKRRTTRTALATKICVMLEISCESRTVKVRRQPHLNEHVSLESRGLKHRRIETPTHYRHMLPLAFRRITSRRKAEDAKASCMPRHVLHINKYSHT